CSNGFVRTEQQDDNVRYTYKTSLYDIRSRRDADEHPQSTEKRVMHVEEQGDHASSVLYRRMSQQADPALYELRLRKVYGKWLVAGETVLPWPDLTAAKGFLPPRTR